VGSLYAKCPKCAAETRGLEACPRCGVIFAKYLKTVVGGALFQVLLPLVFGAILLVRNRDAFAASVTLWWAAVAIMDVAPYVYDAYQPQFILLTGRTGDEGAHDFVDVLGDLGLLKKAQPIGYGVRAFGAGVMVLALAWGAYVLWLQFRARRED
jgi:hypothetical protein